MSPFTRRRLMIMCAGATACLPASAAFAAPTPPLLLADTNRDGVVTAADADGRDQWSDDRGAVFIPNLDDDDGRCERMRPDPLDPRPYERCNDASDEKVNGLRDVADLARIVVTPQAGVGAAASGKITLEGPGAANARVFVQRGDTWVPAAATTLTSAELRSGMTLGIEGKDLASSREMARVAVVLTISDGAATSTDRVAFTLARFRNQNDMMNAETLIVRAIKPPLRQVRRIPATTGRRLPPMHPLLKAIEPDESGISPPMEMTPALRRALRHAEMLAARGQYDFTTQLDRATRGVVARISPLNIEGDNWIQDLFEPGWVEMPAPGGVHRMRVLVRPPEPTEEGPARPRVGKEQLYSSLDTTDLGVADVSAAPGSKAGIDGSMNNGGNIEGLPPSPGRPEGSILIGSLGNRRADPKLMATLAAQSRAPLVVVNTSWLSVGHVDETLHVVRSDNPRGWTFAVSDPRAGMALLRRAKAQGFGRSRFGDPGIGRPGASINEVLANRALMRDNQRGARLIDAQVRIIERELGIPRSEMVSIPVILKTVLQNQTGGPVVTNKAPRKVRTFGTYHPNMVNGLSVTPTLYVSPDPHGPKVRGRDIFQQAVRRALGRQGVTVRFVEDRIFLHSGDGEVHCGSNALRTLG